MLKKRLVNFKKDSHNKSPLNLNNCSEVNCTSRCLPNYGNSGSYRMFQHVIMYYTMSVKYRITAAHQSKMQNVTLGHFCDIALVPPSQANPVEASHYQAQITTLLQFYICVHSDDYTVCKPILHLFLCVSTANIFTSSVRSLRVLLLIGHLYKH